MNKYNSHRDFWKDVVTHLGNMNHGPQGVFEGSNNCEEYSHILAIPKGSSKEEVVKRIIENDGVEPDLFPKKPHRYAHHLNSSQVVCYEFFRPLITAEGILLPEMLKCLAQMGIPSEMFANGKAQFEYVPDSAEETNFDFYIDAPQTDAKAYFEIKYTEQGFGPCKNDDRHEKKFKSTYRRLIDNCVCLKRIPAFDESWRKNYQLFRNVLRLTKSNWKNEYIIFLFPEENKAAKKHFDDFVEEFINPAYKSHIIEAHWEDMTPMSDRFRDKFFFYTK